MKQFRFEYEGAASSHYALIREFCSKNDIVIKRMGKDPLFVTMMHVKIECEKKTLANKLQKFIWDELNYGAFCELKKA